MEDNRLQVYFPDKPRSDVITALKRHGYRWTPTLRCWQAYRGEYRLQETHRFLSALYPETSGLSPAADSAVAQEG